MDGGAGYYERERQRQAAVIARLEREERRYRLLQWLVPTVIMLITTTALAVIWALRF